MLFPDEYSNQSDCRDYYSAKHQNLIPPKFFLKLFLSLISFDSSALLFNVIRRPHIRWASCFGHNAFHLLLLGLRNPKLFFRLQFGNFARDFSL